MALTATLDCTTKVYRWRGRLAILLARMGLWRLALWIPLGECVIGKSRHVFRGSQALKLGPA